MSRVYSTRFALFAGASGTTGVTYTVPGGNRAIITEISVIVSGQTAAGYLRLSLAGLQCWNSAYTTAANYPIQWQGALVLMAGETMRIYADSGSMWGYVGGYLFQDP